MKGNQNVFPKVVASLLVTWIIYQNVNCSLTNNVENRKRSVEDSKRSFSSNPKNKLKMALLDAIEASSNEDFDVIDVMYAVAKTYKDEPSIRNFFSKTQQRTKKPKTRRRRKSKRSLETFNSNDAVQSLYNYNLFDYNNISNIVDSYNDIFSPRKPEPRVANLFNVPTDDKFFGLMIPTNQALSELALKQLEWICFLFVSHIFDTNTGGY